MKKFTMTLCVALGFGFLISCNDASGSNGNSDFAQLDYTYQEVADDKPGYHITATVPDFQENDTVFLCMYQGKKPYYKDTALLDANLTADFSADTTLERGLYLMLLPDKTFFEVIVDSDQHFQVSTKKPRYAEHMEIEGSDENAYFYSFMKSSSDLSIAIRQMQSANPNDPALMEKQKELQALQLQFAEKEPRNLFAKYVAVQKDPEIKENPPGDSLYAYRTFMDEYFKNFDFKDERLLNTPAFENRLEGFFDQLVVQTPDSIIYRADRFLSTIEQYPKYYQNTVTYLINKYAEPKIMGMDAVYVHLAEEYYAKGKAFWASEKDVNGILKSARLMKPLLVGQKAPNIKDLTGLNGQKVSLYDMKSPLTLLIIWDSGCGRCRAKTPLFNKIQKAYADKGLQIFGASLELEPGPWKKWISENGYNWTHGYDPNHTNEFRDIYSVDAVPAMYLLDKDKKIIAKKLDPQGLANFLDDMFKTNRAQTMDLRVPQAAK